MEERYEFRGKIGQGGLGSVYRAFDLRMSREVAIKRIIANTGDNSISEEATKQLMQEAGSLASLQHPNIVTIYDVGTDADGPFVVMELLTGETLEEIIGRGSFTWADFRQLAMQTLEALIAAQELHNLPLVIDDRPFHRLQPAPVPGRIRDELFGDATLL